MYDFRVSCPQTEMSPLLSRFQRRSSDHSETLMKAPYRRNSSPLRSSDLNVLTLTDRRLASNLSVPEWMDHFGPDVKESHSPCCLCLPRCSRFQFSPCQPRAPVCPCSSSLPHPPQFFPPTSCGHGDGCPWMMGLLGEGLSCMGSLAELCQGTVIHVGELLGAEGGSLSLVRKHCGGRSSLEDVIALTSLGHLNEGNPYSQAHLELVKGIMGCVMATASPINLRDASEVNVDVMIVHVSLTPMFQGTDEGLKIRNEDCMFNESPISWKSVLRWWHGYLKKPDRESLMTQFLLILLVTASSDKPWITVLSSHMPTHTPPQK